MFGRVKFGTINASQLFFEGSHVFSFFFSFFSISGYMPATKMKSLHSTAGSENIWQLCCHKLFHTIRRSQFQRQMWDQAQNHFKETKPVNTLRPRDSFCFLLVSSHFFYPNFKRPIPSQKWILAQHVRVPLNIPKHSTKISCQCTSPFRHLARATPKTTRKPFRGHGRRCWPRPPWPPQRSAARPRRHGLSEPPYAAASGLERPRDARRKAGQLRPPSRNKAYSHGMFLRVVGQIFLDRSYR